MPDGAGTALLHEAPNPPKGAVQGQCLADADFVRRFRIILDPAGSMAGETVADASPLRGFDFARLFADVGAGSPGGPDGAV